MKYNNTLKIGRRVRVEATKAITPATPKETNILQTTAVHAASKQL